MKLNQNQSWLVDSRIVSEESPKEENGSSEKKAETRQKQNWAIDRWLNQKKKTETKWKQSWGIELWREGAGVPIPVTFPPIETIAMCFVFLKWFLCIFSTKNYPIEKKQPREKKQVTSPSPPTEKYANCFVCLLFVFGWGWRWGGGLGGEW